ncbi:FG-GAP repeat protein [Acidobacteriota bacterium]
MQLKHFLGLGMIVGLACLMAVSPVQAAIGAPDMTEITKQEDQSSSPSAPSEAGSKASINPNSATSVSRSKPSQSFFAPGDLVELWRYEYTEPSFHLAFGTSAAVGDANVDNITSPGEIPEDLEVMTGTDEPYLAPCLGKWRLFDSRGALEWELCTQSDEPGASPFFSDIDEDCLYEMGGGCTSGAIFQVLSNEGQFEWYWPTTLRDAFDWSEYWHPAAAVANFHDTEPGREIVTARYDGIVRMFRGPDGARLWETRIATGDPTCWGIECPLFINSSPAVGDLDGDGILDIVLGTNNDEIVSLDRNGVIRWEMPVPAR